MTLSQRTPPQLDFFAVKPRPARAIRHIGRIRPIPAPSRAEAGYAGRQLTPET